MKKRESIKGMIGWACHGAAAMKLPGMNFVAKGKAIIWWTNGLSSPPGNANPIRHLVAQQGPDKRAQQITHSLFQKFIDQGNAPVVT